MSSPFPGMDPYLEDPALWQDLHLALITYAREALQPLLVPQYYAHLGERVYIEDPRQALGPDLTILRRSHGPREPGRVATLAGDEPTILTFDLRQREAFIEIRATSSHEGVTVIEFVSPSNKYASGQGKVEYRKKQDQVTAGSANLVEVDLLRRGQPVVMAPVGQLLALPSFDYVACVNRASQPGQAEIYPFTLRERMPRVKIPLRVEDADVVLDLPSVFTRGYDSGAFGLRVDYRLPPPGPLRADDGPWLDGLLRDAGARGA